jgi:iron complex transport system substrate-binding protein
MPNRTETTRRNCIKYGATVALGAGIAGCSSESDTTTDETGTGTTADTATETTGDGSYSVTMAPAGTVTFAPVPERWATYYPGYADMGVAIGLAEDLTGVGQPAE